MNRSRTAWGVLLVPLALGPLLTLWGCQGDPLERLAEQLEAPDAKARYAAVEELASMESEMATGVLLKALQNPHRGIRHQVCLALQQRADSLQGEVAPLLPLLKDEEPLVCYYAALAIQAIEPQNEAFVPVLEHALLSAQGEVFLEVAEMKAAGRWATSTLLRLLGSREFQIRGLSAYVLGEIYRESPDPKVESALVRLTFDPEEHVRSSAKEALSAIRAGVE